MRFNPASAATIALLFTTTAASADTAVVGAVRDIHRGGYGGMIEYHWTETLAAKPNWSAGWAGAAHTEADDDRWIGFGVSAEYGLTDSVFVEASFMPGYYSEGATDLGGNLHFRTTVGIGYAVSNAYAVSVAVSHWSNGSIEAWNPGTDMVMLRLLRRY
ncbi:acyloxyacyl hydrolase [Roseovarius sp. 10]|uniref:acyloxyacyl hydrolase n=1 Tax=Roseovarius sp. 10 TaxID=3080563 RepID=UPI002953AB4F|nr:acyloxyacyl hydrolase [Roseovarius sp. 10]MDV7201828.1 acyloxyacyl hydrolase [Roseovarius sp. 10]